MSIRVWKYCRQSTPDEGLTGLQMQNRILDDYIAKHGYSLAGKTEAVESGLDPERESIHEVIRKARENAYDMLIVSYADRLLRDPVASIALFHKLQGEGVRIYAVMTEEELPDKRQDDMPGIMAYIGSAMSDPQPQTGCPCDVCGQDPLNSKGCRASTILAAGKKYKRIPFLGEAGERCHDCNTLSGHYHHWGCDDEQCPVCGGQLIGCDCEDVECIVFK